MFSLAQPKIISLLYFPWAALVFCPDKELRLSNGKLLHVIFYYQKGTWATRQFAAAIFTGTRALHLFMRWLQILTWYGF